MSKKIQMKEVEKYYSENGYFIGEYWLPNKTKMSEEDKEVEKAKEIFILMTTGKMTVTEINSLTDKERFFLSKCFDEKAKLEEEVRRRKI